MSVEENKALMARYFAESNAIGADASKMSALVGKYVSPGCIYHFAAGDMSLEQCSQFFAAYYKAYPDMTWTVDDLVAEGQKVVVRTTWMGTQSGEWLGAAPTGKKYTQPGMTTYRLDGGKIVECWVVNDAMKELETAPGS